MVALVMVLGLCAAMAGCNSSEESSSTANSGSIAVAEKTDSAPAETVGSEASDSVQETEAPAEDNSALYAYYDELAAEFEKEGNNSVRYFTKAINVNVPDEIIYDNGYVFFSKMLWQESAQESCIYRYSIEEKELQQILTYDGYNTSEIYYCSGYIYLVISMYGQNSVLYKYDIDGNQIASVENAHPHFFTDTGYVVCYDDDRYLLTPDFQEVKLPPLMGVDSHGLEQEISDFRVIGSYGNKLYVCAYKEYNLYYLDLDSMTWNKASACADKGFAEHKAIGKYVIGRDFGGSYIYDMDADEFLAEELTSIDSESRFISTYYGGKYNIIRNQGTFYKMQYPSDGSVADTAQYIPLGTESSNVAKSVYFLNDTYYAFKDDAGLFLRSYEKGETEEEIIYVFEN